MENKDITFILNQVYKDLKTRLGNNQIINFYPVDRNEFPPSAYYIDLRVKSIIDVENEQIETRNNFGLNLLFSKNYPQVPPILKFNHKSEIPFHPHVKTQVVKLFNFIPVKYEYLWLDYQPYDPNELISSYLIRMAKSLQFRPEFINKTFLQIGDKDALFWFIQSEATGLFPIDHTSIIPGDPKALVAGGLSQNEHNIQERNRIIQDPPKRIVLRKPEARDLKFDLTTNKESSFKFNIVEESPAYSPEPKVRQHFQVLESHVAEIRSQHDSSYELYINSAARKEIFNHIEWGNLGTHNNRIEQGGILLGDVYVDTQLGLTYGIVWKAIPANYTEGSPISLEMSHESWKKMIDDVDASHSSPEGNSPQIIGWYHTHPNTLDVFMSSTDLATQQRLFAYDWQFAIVLNPHKKIWRAFHGAEAKSCKGFFIQEKEASPSLGILLTAAPVNQSLNIQQNRHPDFLKNLEIKKWQIVIFSVSLIILLLGLLLILLFKQPTNSTLSAPLDSDCESIENSVGEPKN